MSPPWPLAFNTFICILVSSPSASVIGLRRKSSLKVNSCCWKSTKSFVIFKTLKETFWSFFFFFPRASSVCFIFQSLSSLVLFLLPQPSLSGINTVISSLMLLHCLHLNSPLQPSLSLLPVCHSAGATPSSSASSSVPQRSASFVPGSRLAAKVRSVMKPSPFE